MAKVPATDKRVVIERVSPQVDGGRFPAKSTLGDPITVKADVFADGHDQVRVVLRHRRADRRRWTETVMEPQGNDRWAARLTPDQLGWWDFEVTGWVDRFETWLDGIRKKVDAGVEITVELTAAAGLFSAASSRARGPAADRLSDLAKQVSREDLTPEERFEIATSVDGVDLARAHPDRSRATTSLRYSLMVDREAATFSTWYELFPRSWGDGGEHGTFADLEKHLGYVADMGFDVLYLPPIHPIGHTYRKGANNTLVAGKEDVGVPWAIGSELGGHTALNPDLGTMEDFHSLMEAASGRGIEVALDIAFQCSPDHPWVREHPEWFRLRPDGTIQHAENPPKKYQDIYPLDFETSDPEGLWLALKGVFDHWIAHGVRIFRVDNPHTKSFPFWEWVIPQLTGEHPDLVLLSEAFTRPAVMYRLAKAGFNQSYTYFAWRTTKQELITYMSDLAAVADFFRPSFWPNTPDILTEELQKGGRAAFVTRYVLAATLSPACGIYGPAFELMENRPLRPGSEEYLDSEKYQIRAWDRDQAESIAPVITRVNRVRRAHRALQRSTGVTFHDVDNDMILCYSRTHGEDVVLVVVSLDPHHTQSGWVSLEMAALGIVEGQRYVVHDRLTDRRYHWEGSRNFVQMDPQGIPAHIFSISSRVRSEEGFEYFD